MGRHRKRRPSNLDSLVAQIGEAQPRRHLLVPRAKTARKMNREEMTAARNRAIANADRTGISLVEALRQEGVI